MTGRKHSVRFRNGTHRDFLAKCHESSPASSARWSGPKGRSGARVETFPASSAERVLVTRPQVKAGPRKPPGRGIRNWTLTAQYPGPSPLRRGRS